MKTLFIMRHAKSSWDDASLADFDRPLNKRGEKAALFMGEFMHENGLEPSIMINSPAVRARKTAKLVKKAGGFRCELNFDEHIYEASPHALLHVVSDIDDAYPSAMLVGHNPGMEGLIRLLTAAVERMSTATLAVIDLDITRWNEVRDRSGRLRNVFRPKELTSS